MRTHTIIVAATAAAFGVAVVTAFAARDEQQPQTGGGRANSPAASKQGLPDTDEDGQPRTLPALPAGVTLAMIKQGDDIFHGKGGCTTCHGMDAGGMPAMGSGLTKGLGFVPADWKAIDSLVRAGIPEAITRSPIAMPPRGAQSNLTPDEVKLAAAYVWAIANVRGEPWPGGHQTHTSTVAGAPAATQPAAKP